MEARNFNTVNMALSVLLFICTVAKAQNTNRKKKYCV